MTTNNKNIVKDATIKAGKSVHIGDIIYNNTTPEQIVLSEKLKKLKYELSSSQKMILENSQTISTPLEESMLQVLPLIKEQDSLIVLKIYQSVFDMPWRTAFQLSEQLYSTIESTMFSQSAINQLKSNLNPTDSIAKKLRVGIPLLPFVIHQRTQASDTILDDLWQSPKK